MNKKYKWKAIKIKITFVLLINITNISPCPVEVIILFEILKISKS